MAEYYLENTWFDDITLNLKNGNVLAIYTDDGPKGICGQSCSITSPHTYMYLFKTEEEYLNNLDKIGRDGYNSKIRVVVINHWSNQGHFKLVQLND